MKDSVPGPDAGARAPQLNLWAAVQAFSVAALSVPFLAGCVTQKSAPPLAACGSQISAGGGQVIEVPRNASALREIADKNVHFFPGAPPFSVEVWASLPSGDLLLCRANTYRGEYVEGERWRFDFVDDRHQLADHVSWVVQHQLNR